MTFEFLCAGLNFETSDRVTLWLSGGELLRPSGLVLIILALKPLEKLTTLGPYSLVNALLFPLSKEARPAQQMLAQNS